MFPMSCRIIGSPDDLRSFAGAVEALSGGEVLDLTALVQALTGHPSERAPQPCSTTPCTPIEGHDGDLDLLWQIKFWVFPHEALCDITDACDLTFVCEFDWTSTPLWRHGSTGYARGGMTLHDD